MQGLWVPAVLMWAFHFTAPPTSPFPRRHTHPLACLCSTLVGLALGNLGVLPPEAAVYGVVNAYLLPLAVPLLLFAADLRCAAQFLVRQQQGNMPVCCRGRS